MSNKQWSYFYCHSCKQCFYKYCNTKNCIQCGSKNITKLTEAQHKVIQNKARK